MKIVQVLDYFAGGNGVANCAVMYYNLTVRMGIESAVVARLIDKKEWYVRELSYLDELDENDIVMYHMCIGTPLNETICSYPFQKVLVYQNITPPSMIEPYDYTTAVACRRGLAQLDAMKHSFSVCLVMSEFNKQDLIRHGYRKELVTVIEPCINPKDYPKLPDKKMMRTYRDGWVNIVFVGRVSPNKKHEDLIQIFRYYKTNLNPDSRLILAGSGGGAYYERLERYVEKLKLQDVVFTNQISSAQLLAVYQTASVFVCASEHEGYCIPLVEAMYFKVPVIAYDACAVGGTMGGAGILLQDKNPALVAKVIQTVCSDHGFRERIIKRQTERVQALAEDAVFQKYEAWVHTLPKMFSQAAAQCISSTGKNCSPYDVVMVVKAADWETAKRNLKYIRKYLKPKQIVIISSSKMRDLLHPQDAVVFLDEDRLYPGLSFEKVREFFAARQMGLSLTGWYLQQFLKLAYAYVCRDAYYLVWDADTIPLNEIAMLHPQTGRPYFDMKPEYIHPYFSAIRNLTGMEKAETESFIAEHMLFCTRIVKQMLGFIEDNHSIPGTAFFQKILYAADYGELERSFSEFELYGTFCRYVHPDLYEKRHLRTMRCGKMFLGAEPEEEVLAWAAKDKDVISFEHPQQVIDRSRKLSESEKFRGRNTVHDLMKRIYLADRLTFPEWLAQEKDALRMDYPWARKPAYLQSDEYRKAEKEKKAANVVKIAVLGSSEDCYLLGLMFARRGMQVTMADSCFDPAKVRKFQKYWGFQVFFGNTYRKNFKVVDHLSADRNFQFVFFHSAQSGQYEQQEAVFQGAKKGILLEHGNNLDMERLKGVKEAALINMDFIREDALLWGERKSVLELWDGTACSTVSGLLSQQIKTVQFQDRDSFLDHVQRMHDYLDELKRLKQKYRISKEQERLLCGG